MSWADNPLTRQWAKEREAQNWLADYIFKQGPIAPKPETLMTVNLDPHEKDECKHKGFIAREVDGPHRYVCRECNKRFRMHPWVKPRVMVPKVDHKTLIAAMGQFREGMTTITEALTATRMSIEEFNETIKKCFPPQDVIEEMHHIGSSQSIPIRVDTEPQRTSCPKELDDFIHDPDVSLSELKDGAFQTRFPDITEMAYYDSPAQQAVVYEFGFIDGTTQRVVVTDTELRWKNKS